MDHPGMEDEDYEGDEFINEDEIEEVIELQGEEEPTGEDEVIEGLEGMDLDTDSAQAAGGSDVPVKDDAELVFDKHKGSVFCVRTDPQSLLAVTGGEDDKGFVWRLSDGGLCFQCTGHVDSVVAASFNRTSRYVASADMSGIIKVWSTEDGTEIWSVECSDIEWMTWHHLTEALLAGTTDGTVWLWKVPAGDCKIYQGPGCSCSCGKLTPDGKRLVAGYEDGSVRVWDLKAGSVEYCVPGPEGGGSSLTSIDCHSDNKLVVTGSTDVTAKLININSKKVLCTFDCHSEGPEGRVEEDSVESVAFAPCHPYMATGTLSGQLVVWDLSSQTQRIRCQHQSGIVRCVWDPCQPSIYTGTLDGTVHLWDTRTGKREAQWSGHRAEILDFDFTRDGSKMVTSSGDGTARVYNLTSLDR